MRTCVGSESEKRQGGIEGSKRRCDKSHFYHPDKWIRYLIAGLFLFRLFFFQTGNLSIRHMRTPLHYNCRQLCAVQAEWT